MLRLWLAAATALTLSIDEVRHPAIDGGPVLGRPRADVTRLFEANGWTREAPRSGPKVEYFGHAGIHLEVVVTYDGGGRSRAARVRPWHDEASDAFMARHYAGLIGWLIGRGRYRVRKEFANGELMGLEVGL